ncbi:PilW family protein [Altericista sp. CCNU0014]|uniref:PilW family protein n=1 Tax=Altericista sp. CCNU0014 TaxID=3082949 RepID=UPI00384BDA18
MPPFKNLLRHQRGLSLLELLVTVAVSTAILSVALGLIVTQRQEYLEQQANTDANQTVQSAMDLIGMDIRLGGELVGAGLSLPVIRIVNGSAGGPDNLIIQRKLLATSLNVCEDVTSNPTEISVATTTAVEGCSFSDGNGDFMPDDVEDWRDYRCSLDSVADCQDLALPCQQIDATSANAECSWAYIYNPRLGAGEFFLYSGEKPKGGVKPAGKKKGEKKGAVKENIYQIEVSNPNFANDYPVADRPKLYILEQREYFLGNPDTSGDRILTQHLVDSKLNTYASQAPYQIVNRLRDLQIKAIMASGEMDGFNPGAPPYTDWQTLQAIKVSFSVANAGPDAQPTIQTLTSQFLPRNSISRP